VKEINLNIPGYHYNSDVTSKNNSLYYDSNDSDDTWIEVAFFANDSNNVAVNYVVNGEVEKVCLFPINDALERRIIFHLRITHK
jgi:hypothetical protein